MEFIARLRQLATLFGIAVIAGCGTTQQPQAAPRTGRFTPPGYLRGSRNSQSERVIVFVHGILGDGLGTWTNERTGAYFPQLAANDPTFEDTDIWVHDFPTELLRRGYSIDELGDNLRLLLDNDNVIANHKHIIFVCHSLGGLAVRAYLLKHRDKLPASRVPMLYFFSTPTTGSDLANLGALISKNPTLAEMRKMTTDTPGVLGVLQAQWADSEFSRETVSHCAYEKLPTRGIQIVERESATNLCNAMLDPILADHIDIVKPADERAPSYIALRNAYRATLNAPSSDKRAAWNLQGNDYGLLRISNYTRDPTCVTCWASETTAVPGDVVSLDLHYRNDSNRPATNTRCRLQIPVPPVFGGDVEASIWSDDTAGGHASVTLHVDGGPIALVPEDAYWYPNDAATAVPLPANQEPADIVSPAGLRIGDVDGGWQFRSDVVIRLRCVPITVAVVRGLFGKLDDLLKATTDRDVRKIFTDFHFAGGHLERSSMTGPLTWVVVANDLHREDDVEALVYYYNSGTAPLRHVRVVARPEGWGDGLWKVSVFDGEQVLRSEQVNVAFAPGADGLSYGFAELTKPFWLDDPSYLQQFTDRIDGDVADGVVVGELGPRTGFALALMFEVTRAGEEPLSKADRAAFISQAQITHEPSARVTTLNNDKNPSMVQVSVTSDHAAWLQHLEGVKVGQTVTFSIRYHVTGDMPAVGLHAFFRLDDVHQGTVRGVGRIAASNAEAREQIADVVLDPAHPVSSLRYLGTRWFWDGSKDGVEVDAARLRTDGLPLGDVLPEKEGYLLVYYEVVEISPSRNAGN